MTHLSPHTASSHTAPTAHALHLPDITTTPRPSSVRTGMAWIETVALHLRFCAPRLCFPPAQAWARWAWVVTEAAKGRMCRVENQIESADQNVKVTCSMCGPLAVSFTQAWARWAWR